MWATEVPAFLPFYLGAIIALCLNDKLRPIVTLIVPLIGGYLLWFLPEGIHWQFAFFDFQLTPFKADKLSIIFGAIFHIAAFIAGLYAWHVRDKMQQIASMLYAGSAIGAVFAGDLITIIFFWEMLALTSVFLVWARGTERAIRSGLRYLYFQILSGLLLIGGTILYVHAGGDISFGYIGLESTAGWLIFLAFGIKCAFPFFHNWLTDAYAESTPTGTVFLSAFTTKTAVYMFARAYPGTEVLIYVGAAMTCFPIFYAVIENDLRRVLAYSMINQIGFMVCGIGIGTALAINGAVAHAFNDIIFKGLLFMSMGAVLHMTGRMNGSDLGGLYKSMPKTTILCIIGAASISAFPLFSGFVSKSMVVSAAINEGYDWIWLMMLFASAGVFHHAGIKIPYFAFFAHDSGIRTTEPPTNMLLPMGLAAVLCIAIGVFPNYLYSMLPFEVNYTAYDTTHVLAQTQILFFSALAFVWLTLRGIYPPELRSINIDAEWLYRRLLPNFVTVISGYGRQIENALTTRLSVSTQVLLYYIMHRKGPIGKLAQSTVTSTMVSWVTLLLASYLLLSFL
ncbi:MAG: Na(+)/H(+) antiporter subunit D [Alteromonadaceae bacterium]|nr:Na(+)/H(+) antiporter subunit D [Alteromonadaceae bacterium]